MPDILDDVAALARRVYRARSSDSTLIPRFHVWSDPYLNAVDEFAALNPAMEECRAATELIASDSTWDNYCPKRDCLNRSFRFQVWADSGFKVNCCFTTSSLLRSGKSFS